MPDFVTTLKTLLEKTTPGPWQIIGTQGIAIWVADEIIVGGNRLNHRDSRANVELICTLRNHAEAILRVASLLQNIQSRQVLFVHGMSDEARVEWLQEAIKAWQREIREALAALDKEA